MHQLTTVEYHLRGAYFCFSTLFCGYLVTENSVFHYIHYNNMHVLKKDSTVVFLDSNFSKLMPKDCLDTAVHHLVSAEKM